MPCGKKRKRHKIATHKRKKRLRKNRHKKKKISSYPVIISNAGVTIFSGIMQLSTGLPTTCFATFTFPYQLKSGRIITCWYNTVYESYVLLQWNDL